MLIGWYSREQKQRFAKMNARTVDSEDLTYIVVYETPDGREVELTEVREPEDGAPPKFPDAVCVGEVVKYKRARLPFKLTEV